MFNILIDELPVTVEVDGLIYPINYQADTMIKISLLIEDNPSASTDEKIQAEVAFKQIELFYPSIPSNLPEAMERLIDFYSHVPTIQATRKIGKLEIQRRIFSFKYDASMIYSAFIQQYSIDNIAELHWFTFKSLLEGLTDDCLFVKAMQFRTVKITNDMSKSEKAYYRKMKRLYALPDNRPQEQKDKEFAAVLFSA